MSNDPGVVACKYDDHPTKAETVRYSGIRKTEKKGKAKSRFQSRWSTLPRAKRHYKKQFGLLLRRLTSRSRINHIRMSWYLWRQSNNFCLRIKSIRSLYRLDCSRRKCGLPNLYSTLVRGHTLLEQLFWARSGRKIVVNARCWRSEVHSTESLNCLEL